MKRLAAILALTVLLLCSCEKKRPTGDPKVFFDVESISAAPGESVTVEGSVKDPAGIAHIDFSAAVFSYSKSMSLVGSYPTEYEFSESFTIPADAAKSGEFVVTAVSYDNRSITAKLPVNLPAEEATQE